MKNGGWNANGCTTRPGREKSAHEQNGRATRGPVTNNPATNGPATSALATSGRARDNLVTDNQTPGGQAADGQATNAAHPIVPDPAQLIASRERQPGPDPRGRELAGRHAPRTGARVAITEIPRIATNCRRARRASVGSAAISAQPSRSRDDDFQA